MKIHAKCLIIGGLVLRGEAVAVRLWDLAQGRCNNIEPDCRIERFLLPHC